MPNIIDDTGLTIKTNTEIIADLEAALQGVYGADINVDSNSPDGQALNIFAQVVTDMLELLVLAYNTFDPDKVSGVVLDQRVAINGVVRTAGTYTIAPVSITVVGSITLYGLDQDVQPVFTVNDGTGNDFYLITTTAFSTETKSCPFRAKELGAVEVLQNTITNQTTITLGVTTVNNPLVATTTGLNEETDVALKVRRLKSFQLAGTGPADAVLAAILGVTGVTDARVEEDTTGHTIWVIVENGADADIAQVIYEKKAAGCGLIGDDASVVVTRPNGQTATIVFDRPISLNLYIEFTIQGKVAGATFDEPYIKAQLAAQLLYSTGQSANANDILALLFSIEPDAIFTAVGVSKTAGSYVEGPLVPTTLQNKFVVAAARITINHPA